MNGSLSTRPSSSLYLWKNMSKCVRYVYFGYVCLLVISTKFHIVSNASNLGLLPYYNFHQLFHFFLDFFEGNLFLLFPTIEAIFLITVKFFFSFFSTTSFLFRRCRLIVIIKIFFFTIFGL
jgi:hypothetical protein